MLINRENARELGLEFVGTTTIWNWRRCNGLISAIYDSKSNIYKKIQEFKTLGEKGGFTLQLEAIGRTQRSASRVAIYRGVVDASKHGSRYYEDENAEFFII